MDGSKDSDKMSVRLPMFDGDQPQEISNVEYSI